MTYLEFTDALHAAGWRPVADAQYENIRQLWRMAFPLHFRIECLECQLQEADSEIDELNQRIGGLT